MDNFGSNASVNRRLAHSASEGWGKRIDIRIIELSIGLKEGVRHFPHLKRSSSSSSCSQEKKKLKLSLALRAQSCLTLNCNSSNSCNLWVRWKCRKGDWKVGGKSFPYCRLKRSNYTGNLSHFGKWFT